MSAASPVRAVGTLELRGVHKSFRSYRTRSFKELLIHVAKREPIIDRRPILRGLNVHIAPGERVGIVGRNGAGKSTLFRLMSRLVVADEGEVICVGRVAPLIEITAGFVPDLSGAENLRLNAAILGLSRRETEARFERIVAFAELESFMETPVRYYSSGMQARLGFSVVVHVDADIVLIDEALSVGDVAFQQRCLEKMAQVSAGGATVVFVSHDFEAVRRFCRRAIWLDEGTVRADGEVDAVIDALQAAGRAAGVPP